MDATCNYLKNTGLFFGIALALVAVPARAQTAAFSLSSTSINLNQSTSTGSVTVTSTGDPITFTPTISYAADPNTNNNWLKISSATPATTPNTVFVQLNVPPVLPGTYTATVTLTASSPTGVAPATITVTFINGSGGTGSSLITASLTSISLSSPGNTLQAVGISTTSGLNISLTASTSVSWLTATLASTIVSSAAPTSVTIQANPAGLQNGTTYQGNVTVTPTGGTAISIFVSFAVTSGGGSGALTITPQNTAAWTYTTGGVLPTTSNYGLIDASASTYSASVDNGVTWLLVNGVSSTSSIALSNGINIGPSSAIANLTTGAYTGTVTITDSAGATATFTVTLSVNGGTSTGLTISQSSLAFTSLIGGSSQSTTLSVTSTTGGAFSATSNASWLTAAVSTSSLASNTAGSVTVTVAPSGLPAGTYSGQLIVTVGTQSQAVSVTLTIGSTSGGGTGAGVSPTSVSVAWQSGTNNLFVNQPLISLTGTSGAWSSAISYGVGNSWLSLSKGSGTSLPDQTTAIINPSGLAAGSYTATITFTLPSGTQTTSVNLTVTSGAVLLSTPGGAIFNYLTGGSVPAGQSIFFSSSDGSDFNLTGAVTTNASWLTVTAFQKSITLTANPSGLTSGVYSGTITAAPAGLPSLTIPVTLVIDNGTGTGGSGPLTFSPTALTFSAAPGTNPSSQVLSVLSSVGTSFTITSNQSWLSVTPTSATTNTNVTVSVTSAALPSGSYTGTLSFNSGSAIQTVQVSLTVTGSGASGNVTASPTSMTFSGQAGGSAPATQSLTISPATGTTAIGFTVTTTTTSGGSWLSVTGSNSTSTALTVAASITGLSAGTYNGNIAITPSGGTVLNVPVTLTVNAAPFVSATPTNLSFTFRAGGTAPAAQQISVSGNGASLSFAATASSTGNWLQVSPPSGSTPATVNVTVNTTSLAVGDYTGSVTIAGANGATGSTTVSVALKVTAPLPTISKITNAASYASAGISPGEIITLFGTDLGPATASGLTLDSSGKVATTLAGVQVLINNFPSPMIFASNTQVSAVVPYELAQFTTATVLVKYLGQTSNGVVSNVSTTAPGVFTQNSQGTGTGSILNANGSLNSPANPATRGDTVALYMTGEGQTSPPGVTGKITTVNATPPLTPAPLLPVSVLVGGQPAAAIPFFGEAPGLVSGVMQVNFTIPTNIAAGDVSVVVSVGGNPSQNGVTISVK
jgi:uncharacterized protein (TIGR03437 family)